MNKETLLIVGASVRAQVESAVVAGFKVHAFDFFADRDVAAKFSAAHFNGSITRIDSYSEISHQNVLDDCNYGILCGGIENRAELVKELESKVTILGTAGEDLARIQDAAQLFPFLNAEMSKNQGVLRFPETVSCLAELENAENVQFVAGDGCQAGVWLRKSKLGSGGLDVGFAGPVDLVGVDQRHYFQKYLIGQNVSVLFVSGGSKNFETAVVGVSLQLVGEEFGAQEFQYCGSIGPVFENEFEGMGREVWNAFPEFGNRVARELQIKGVWGTDFIINEDGVFPIDINPRFTASAEIYESQLRWETDFSSLIGLHVASCTLPRLDLESIMKSSGSRQPLGLVEGKAVLFNSLGGPILVDEQLSERLYSRHAPSFFGGDKCGVSLSDVPKEGAKIEVGHPILTIRVRAKSMGEVRAKLEAVASELLNSLPAGE